MVVAASTSPNLNTKPNFRSQSNPKRPPLLPSERENNVPSLPNRRPKSREVNSRYLSTTSSTSTSGSSSSTLSNSSHFSSLRRCNSPIPARISSPAMNSNFPASNAPAIKARSLSAERRRPSTPRNTSEVSAAAKLLVSSTRSLSVSFQGESFAVPKGKPAKPALTPSSRRGTPERKRSTPSTTSNMTMSMSTPMKGGKNGENSRPFEHHQPWPGRSRTMSGSMSLSRSVDLDSEGKKVVRALQRSLTANGNGGPCGESVVSDTESLSSECNSGSSIVVNSRLRHGFEPCSPMARNSTLKVTVTPKLVGSKLGNDSPGGTPRGTVSSRGFASPIRGAVRPSSPSKLGSSVAFEKYSPSRGMASPSRVRNGTNQGANRPSVLTFGADVRRIKVGDNRLGDAHFLRLLHNRHLQWRFVNARAEASLFSQKVYAERSLYNAWKKTLELRGAVSSKRKELQWLRLKLKLVSILKGQMLSLEDWALMEKDHCSSLSGAAESLKASIIRLPVVGGARANIQDLKDAICSAADVMQAMASSICSLLSKVEEVNVLVAEVAGMTSKEHALLSECKDILSTLAAMQVKDCSLRAHVLQLKYTPSNLVVKA